jgi:uncharacterized protein YgiM (DUF1202 family)
VRLQAQYANARQADTTSPTPNDVVALARKYLGSPYATIGNTPSQGFSCIGFVNFVFHQLGVFVPYDIDQAWNSEPHVALTNLMPGDILFYSNTVFAGLSHVAIYIGNDEMIGADNFAVGVTTDRITDPYWTEHYTGATRPLALAGSIPTPVQAGLVIPAPTPTAAPLIATLPVGGTVQPMSNQVAMYSGPGYQYTPMDTLNPSMVLTIVQILGGWYNVHVGTTYGWVSANLVRTVTLTHVPEPREQVPTPFSHASAKTSTVAGTQLYVAVGPLNIRSGPGKIYKVTGSVLPGTRLTVLSTTPHWAHVVTPSGVTCWVDIQYLSSTPPPARGVRVRPADGTTPPPNQPTPALAVTARVAVPALNVRARPDEHAQIITVLFAGEAVHVVSRTEGWLQIELRSGTVGWASAAYLVTN